jgi:predicted nucleotidyltransferase
MVKNEIMKQIKDDFQFAMENQAILGIILYGSHARDDSHERSDVDVCIVVPKNDLYEIYNFIMDNLNNNLETYDIHFFEEVPLYIRFKIINEGIVVLSRDELALSEYFYKYRKFWTDYQFRLLKC